jgi:hypothetical protein
MRYVQPTYIIASAGKALAENLVPTRVRGDVCLAVSATFGTFSVVRDGRCLQLMNGGYFTESYEEAFSDFQSATS